MERFVGTKQLNAKPMTRGEYNVLRGWALPDDENCEVVARNKLWELEGYLLRHQRNAS